MWSFHLGRHYDGQVWGGAKEKQNDVCTMKTSETGDPRGYAEWADVREACAPI